MPALSVRSFYERFPYPQKAADHLSGDILPSSFDAVRHHCWAGHWPAGRSFRALVAGGGTGDAIVSLGLSMRRRGIAGSIHYVDLSKTSAEIARSRAEHARLDNVTFEVGPIEAVRGEYDYIDLSGVLPIIGDPAALLRHLASLLVDDGAMGVMSYGRVGRTGVEPFRRIYRTVMGDNVDTAAARELIAALPPHNWLRANPKLGVDLDRIGDVELADRLLAPHEFAYSVTELAEMFDRAGLPIRAFIPSLVYEPAHLLKSGDLRDRLAGLSYIERAQVAEDAQGDLNKHVFYAAKIGAAPIDIQGLLDRDDVVLLPRNLDCRGMSSALGGGADAVSVGIRIDAVERSVTIRGGAEAARFVAALEGEPTVGALRSSISDDTIRYMSRLLVAVEALHFAVPSR